MIKHWTKFPGRPHGRFRSDGVRVTINKKGILYMNQKAWALLGHPRAAELMFDKSRSVIGIMPANPDKLEAFPVKDKTGTKGKQIFASAFCMHFGISLGRSTGQFNEIEMDKDGVMNLTLTTLSAISRGAR